MLSVNVVSEICVYWISVVVLFLSDSLIRKVSLVYRLTRQTQRRLSITSSASAGLIQSQQTPRCKHGLLANPVPPVIIMQVFFFFLFLSQTTAQILFTISERKTRKTITHILEPIYILQALNTGTCIQQGDLFILRAYAGTGVSHS